MSATNIEEQAIQTYQENLLFLQGTDPKLYEKLEALNLAIEKGYYKERYSLEYINGYFDVQDFETKKFLYGEDSTTYGTQVAKSIDFTKIDNLFETFYNVNLSKEDLKEIEDQSPDQSSWSSAAALIDYSHEFASKTTTMKKLYKFIFFGVGLGSHLLEVHKKLQSNVYYIIEDDLELFRLSLFVTPYQKLSDNGAVLYFSIFDEDSDFRNKTMMFLNEQFVYNHYIKFFYMLSHDKKRMHDVQNIIVGQTYLTFNHSALMTSLLRPLEYLKKGYKILDINSSYQNTLFQRKPVLLIAAGPSFEKKIQWIIKNQGKFIIVIVSALISKFEEIGVKPDIITHVHGFEDAMPHLKKVKEISFFDDTIELFGGMSYPPFVENFKKENVFIFEGSSRYKDNYGGITSSNIGALSYGLLLMLHTDRLYLLGLDFAPDQSTGKTHISSHAHTRNLKLEKDETLGGEVEYKNEIIEVEGNFQKIVFTSLLLNGMKEECDAISKTYKCSYNTIYNLSDGVKINDTKPLDIFDTSINTLTPLNKSDLHKELKTLFNSRSQNYLTQNEVKNIYKKIEYYDSVLDILNKHLSTPQPNLDKYHYNLLGTFYNILTDTNEEVHSSDMNYIITLYLQFVSGYIFDLINTKEITNHKRLIKHLDKVVIPQITKVIKYFKDKMLERVKGIEVKES